MPDVSRFRPGRVLTLATACLVLGLPPACGPRQGAVEVPADAPLAGMVNPWIGTAGEGQTFPGAAWPNGLATPSPRTTLNSLLELLDASFLEGGLSFTGYKFGSSDIHGFDLTHLSGVGCPEFGTPLIVPAVGRLPRTYDEYALRGSAERAFAGYYGVTLGDGAIDADMTARPRTALLRFTYHDPGPRHIVIDAANSLALTRSRGALRIVDAQTLEGSAAWGPFCSMGEGGRLYFVVRLSRPAQASGLLIDGEQTDAVEGEGDVAAWFTFGGQGDRVIEVAVGLSLTSRAGAQKNLDAEQIPFAEAITRAARAWHERLGRIEIEGGSADERIRFYTALYHAQLNPMIASDVDGAWRRFGDRAVVTDSTHTHYTVFSLWDTYRTLHPLLTLVYPDLQAELLQTMADMTLASGRPPRWEVGGEEANVMVGDPAAIVFADSWAKGLTDFATAPLLARLFDAAEDPGHRPGVESYLKLGYIPMELAGGPVGGSDKVWGPAATTLEYAFADWALSRLAAGFGYAETAAEFADRSIRYRTLYDPETGTLRPKFADGSFLTPYDPDLFIDDLVEGTGGPGFVEGTAWQYAFMVPHDLAGLMELHGADRFVARLQAVFDQGRFTSYNEPDLLYPWLFTLVEGEAGRTQRLLRQIVTTDFPNTPEGLPGNDDTGTLSAWYVFSAMGFYPVTPGLAEYRLGSPLFRRVVLHLTRPYHSGDTFVIEAPANTSSRTQVATVTLNGAPVTTPVLPHDAVSSGGVMTMEMVEAGVP